MIDVLDRVPEQANRKLITPEDGQTPYYATVTYADAPIEAGTPLNRALFMALQGMESVTTVFNDNGSITETYADNSTMTTIFNDDGSITQVFNGVSGATITKQTMFKANGNIEEVIS